MCDISKASCLIISGLTLSVTLSLLLYAYYPYYDNIHLDQGTGQGHTDLALYVGPPRTPDLQVKDKVSQAVTKEPESTQNETQGQKVTRPKKPSLLQHLVNEYKQNSANVPKLIEILTKLTDLSGRYDNARTLFTATDALSTVIIPGLDSETVEIRRGVCNLIATASQNHAVVKASAVKAGVLPYLIQLLKFDPVTRPRALFALTSLLRNYPDAEKSFIQAGGIGQVILIGYLPETQARCLNFITDLITERQLCRKYQPNQPMLPWEYGYETQSEDPCDRNYLLSRALQEAGWAKLLCHTARYLKVGDTSAEMTVIGAMHASGVTSVRQMGHLRQVFEGLLEKYVAEPDFRDTKRQLMDVLKWMDEGYSGGTLLVPSLVLVLASIWLKFTIR